MDERIKGEYRKIYSELLSIIMVFAACSLLVKFNLYDMELRACLTEFIILIFAPLYMAVRQYMLGLNPQEAAPKKKRRTQFLTAIFFAAAGFLLSAFFKEGRLGEDSFLYILSFIATFTFVYYVGWKLSAYFADRKSKKYEE